MFPISQAGKLSDEEIVVLTLENQDNFLYLIQRYKQKLFNFIKRITNVADEDAEDILQDVFLKVYLNLNDFDHGFKFSSWIYQIARNQVISNHRKLKARAEGYKTPLDEETVRSLISGLDMEKQADAEILKLNIRKVLNRLNEKYREVLVLKFLEEKSYAEISDIIKKPIGTVGSLMNKAKSEFKKELEKQQIKLGV
ncbi:MAG: RNA polymerase sigma factor [Patescibacteria group bacterium]|jgi:RNA polymerase sigma-70 factor (ECF subfamily)